MANLTKDAKELCLRLPNWPLAYATDPDIACYTPPFIKYDDFEQRLILTYNLDKALAYQRKIDRFRNGQTN